MANPCIVCGSTNFIEAFTAPDWQLRTVPDEFRYVRCMTCRCVRVEPQPEDDVLDRAYPDAYLGEGLEHEVLNAAGRVLGRPEARNLVRLADPAGAALDAGCGQGEFLLRLAAAGWTGRLQGLEPGRAAARARAAGLTIEEKPVEELDAVGEFDLVVIRHVIEHVRDPRLVLDRIGQALRPGGLIYLATPDERALAAQVFGRYWLGWDPPRHLLIFNPESVRRLLHEAGFDIVQERWGFAPAIWTGSLGAAISPRPGRLRRFSSNLNPLVALPAAVAAAIEAAANRSTMYAVTARLRVD